MKEKMYDNYNANSSMRGKGTGMQLGGSLTKPKFNLALGKLGGATETTDEVDNDETITGAGVVGSTPSANVRDKYRKVADLGDAVSELSQSPLHTGKASIAFRVRAGGAAGIATPMESDMSRTKFDFKDYDPSAHR